MISQDTLSSQVNYGKRLMIGLKSPQAVSSANAAMYQNETVDGTPMVYTIVIAGNSTINLLCTYYHPSAVTPFVRLQFDFTGIDQIINYVQYIYTADIDEPYQTSYVLSLSNSSAVTDTFDITLAAVSNAPGTLGVISI